MKSYKNFRIELANFKSGDVPISFTVRVLASPVGGQDDHEKVTVKFPSQLAQHHNMLRRRELLKVEEIIEFGEDLANLLLPPIVRQKYYLSRAKLKPQEGLRIQICTAEPKLAALPWEYIYVWAPGGSAEPIKHAGFLALDRKISIVRYQIPKDLNQTPKDEEEEPGAEIVRIGALLSDGREAGHQELDMVREKNNLELALNGVDAAELKIFPEGKLGGLLDWLTENTAQVFHFAGHGTIEKEPLAKAFTFREEKNLVLVGEDGGEQLWDDENVAMALRGRGILLVVLSACDSGGVGPDNQLSGGVLALVQSGIPAVVGMQFTVRDANAIAFSHQFYLALASGKSIDTAVSEGRQAIFQRPIEAGRDWGVPVLYLQTDHAVLFPRPAKPMLINLALLSLFVVLTGSWFFVHMFPGFSDMILRWQDWLGIGGVALGGLGAFLKMFGVEALKVVQHQEQDSWAERLLRHSYTRRVLATLCVLAVGLVTTTSSIYLTNPGGETQTRIDVYETTQSPGRLRWSKYRELATTEGNRLAGGAALFEWPFRELELVVEDPGGWKLTGAKELENRLEGGVYRVRTYPFKSVNLALVRLPRRIFRLVPTNNLFNELLEDTTDHPAQHELIVKQGAKILLRIDNYRQSVVWVGEGEGSGGYIKTRAESESPSDAKTELESCITGSDRDEMIDSLKLNTRHLPTTIKIQPVGDIKIEVIDKSTEEVYAEKTLSPGELSPEIVETYCLDLKPQPANPR